MRKPTLVALLLVALAPCQALGAAEANVGSRRRLLVPPLPPQSPLLRLQPRLNGRRWICSAGGFL